MSKRKQSTPSEQLNFDVSGFAEVDPKTRPSTVVVVDFDRRSAGGREGAVDAGDLLETTILNRVLDRARRLNW
jgi:hypothetical protein